MRKYLFGKLFIKVYYIIGPSLAQIIKGNEFLTKLCKNLLLELLIIFLKKIGAVKIDEEIYLKTYLNEIIIFPSKILKFFSENIDNYKR